MNAKSLVLRDSCKLLICHWTKVMSQIWFCGNARIFWFFAQSWFHSFNCTSAAAELWWMEGFWIICSIDSFQERLGSNAWNKFFFVMFCWIRRIFFLKKIISWWVITWRVDLMMMWWKISLWFWVKLHWLSLIRHGVLAFASLPFSHFFTPLTALIYF